MSGPRCRILSQVADCSFFVSLSRCPVSPRLPHTPRFCVCSLGITIMPCSQDKREGRGAQGLCSSHHGDLQVCTAASLLGHSDHSCLCFLYSFLHSTSFLLFSRPNSGRNFVRKDSVRMNGVLLIRLVYFQHQDGVLHFLHM